MFNKSALRKAFGVLLVLGGVAFAVLPFVQSAINSAQHDGACGGTTGSCSAPGIVFVVAVFAGVTSIAFGVRLLKKKPAPELASPKPELVPAQKKLVRWLFILGCLLAAVGTLGAVVFNSMAPSDGSMNWVNGPLSFVWVAAMICLGLGILVIRNRR